MRLREDVAHRLPGSPLATERTFDAVIFDWDGTAVTDRAAAADGVRRRVEALCAAGVHVFVVSGTRLANVDGQLAARPRGPGRLFLCLNRGSEVFEIRRNGPVVRARRAATEAEERALDTAARAVVQQLEERGLDIGPVVQRLNRRKIDLLPEPGWEDPPKARIAELLATVMDRLHAAGIAGPAEVVGATLAAGRDAGLGDPRVTTDAKHVEIGLTDKSDSATWAARWLARRGITGRLIVVCGDEFGPLGTVSGSDANLLVPELARAVAVSVGVEPEGVPDPVLHVGGGPESFLELLDAQLERRGDRRVPAIDDDPEWIVRLPQPPAMKRAAEAIGTLTNGWAGIRAIREEERPTTASFLVNGIYTSGAETHLLPGPDWTGLDLPDTTDDERVVDLRTGVLLRTGTEPDGVRTLRFVSAARRHAMALRAEAPAGQIDSGDLFGGTVEGALERHDRGDVRLARAGDPGGGAIVVAARDRETAADDRRVVERVAAWTADPAEQPGWDGAAGRLAEIDQLGFDRLLADHRAAWARRWRGATVDIEGSPDDELAARFATFHVLGASPDDGEAAVGARGLTGPAYGGHVFWDADVFVLPALAAIRPRAARAMLEYRIRRLPAARALAATGGLRGARFPWESARDGSDVTPRTIRGRDGERIRIRTGEQEEHIVAGVAWAASEYAAWTGDTAFLAGPGRELICDTARYWASRIRLDRSGRGHIYGVMGPDEYHPVVDDNAYTNVMARWNLRRAAALVDRCGGDRAEADRWRTLADALVDGWDPHRGMYEQFAGFWGLEPILVSGFAQPPVAADVLLGPDRVAQSQIIKQADVLMLHHLVPDELVAGSLEPALAFYEPRTAHGSSLSPAIHAALYARSGQPGRGLELFRLAARLDLDDITGTTAGGLHLATMGGVWQALAYGFLGMRPRGDVLDIDPCLPDAWESLTVRCRFRGGPIAVRAEHFSVRVTAARPLQVRIAGRPPEVCTPPGTRYPLEGRTR